MALPVHVVELDGGGTCMHPLGCESLLLPIGKCAMKRHCTLSNLVMGSMSRRISCKILAVSGHQPALSRVGVGVEAAIAAINETGRADGGYV